MAGFSPAQLVPDFEKIVSFFEKYHIGYVLIGGAALDLLGRPRMTLDLDFLIQIEEEDLEKLSRQARKEKFHIDTRWLERNPMLRGSQIRLRVGKVFVDLMLPRDAQDEQACKRAKRQRFCGHFYRVIAPEDFVLQKLKVGRPRDFADALSVLERMKGKLNKAYLNRWAKKLGIIEELNYILSL